MITGTVVGLYMAIPMANVIYRMMTRRAEARAAAASGEATVIAGDPAVVEQVEDLVEDEVAEKNLAPIAPPQEAFSPYVGLVIVCVLGITTTAVFNGSISFDLIIAFVLVAALTMVAWALKKASRGLLPAVIWASIVGTLVSSPISPIDDFVIRYASSVNFLSLCTVVLTVAGLALGRDIPALRKVGWQILPVGLVALVISYVASAIIAHYILMFVS